MTRSNLKKLEHTEIKYPTGNHPKPTIPVGESLKLYLEDILINGSAKDIKRLEAVLASLNQKEAITIIRCIRDQMRNPNRLERG